MKQREPGSRWVWGAFRMPVGVFRELHALWVERGRSDEYFGTLVNACLARGGEASGVRAGQAYVDVGTLHGYREAINLLSDRAAPRPRAEAGAAPAAEAVPLTPPAPAPAPLVTSGLRTARGRRDALTRAEVERRVAELGPWFHNIDLGGV